MERQVKVDWAKWERDEYLKLSFKDKIWHHAQNICIWFADMFERLK